MRLKQTIKVMTLGFLPILGALAIVTAPMAANAISTCGVDTVIIDCGSGVNNSDSETSAIWMILLQAINILTAGIGVAALAGIVYGSVLYTTAEGSPEKVKKAIEVIRNVVIGVLAYALLYSGLNFLIPGGLFT